MWTEIASCAPRHLRARKRLYMTATPRIYTERSKSKLAEQGIEVVDMGDYHVYGPELHRLPFAKAVEHRMLSDYRVIVLGVSQASVTPGPPAAPRRPRYFDK